MKVLVLSLLSFVLVSVASAQGLLQPRRTLGNRPARPATTPAQTAEAPASAAESGGRSIEFNGAPIDMVFTVYQDLIGKTVLKDPQTPAATITLQPKKGQELTDEDKIEAIETVLEMNGIHMEPYGEKFVRALPRKDVRKDGIPLIMDPEAPLGESTRVVSLMIPFKNIAIEEAQKALEGFKSNSGILLVFERTNSILVTDTEQIINRMREIAKAIDIASPVTETVEYIQIKYANASEVKQVIDSIVQESMKEQEKNGKAPQNGNAMIQPYGPNRPLLGGLRRPGQPNQPATTPANNPSLVTTVSDADRGMIRGKVVTIADERSNKILIITNAQNMKFFKEVIAALDVETTPDVQVKVYRLKYAEAEDVSDMINDLIGNSASSKDSRGNQNQNARNGTSGSMTRGTTTQARKPANQRTGESKAGELNKDNVTVLADKRINGLVVMARTEDIPTIEQIIESMDIKLSQVLIETVIIEVSLGDDLQTGVDWLRTGDRRSSTNPESMKDSLGRQLYYPYKIDHYDDDGNPIYSTFIDYNGKPQLAGTEGVSDTEAKTLVTTVEDFGKNLWRGSHVETMLGGGGGDNSGLLNTLVSVGTNVAQETALLSPAGSGLNLFAKSDKLNLAAIIKASQSDNRSKYLASPIIMTLDNKEAQIDATEMRYLFKGYTYSGSTYNGTAVPDYEQKELGITIKITPKINPNGTVMLTIEEEYSQEGSGQAITSANGKDMISAATTITRKMSADALLEDGQTVIFAGLTQTVKGEKTGGIPILKDIPIIGKWLFGYVKQTESRNELLVFMTPHVLDDAEVAQAEALRRKKTLSDPRPWEDHGWSLSPIADPVSKQEQMRRIKDEWRIQDEERRTKIAIEKAKVERVKRLEKMSKDEREMWLKMHKAELEEEKQDELEEKMLDEKSQEELKKLAAEVRAKKLGEAEKVIKAAAEEAAAENERGKLDAEKKAKAEEKI